MDLGDARLNKRVEMMVEAFAAKPTANIPMACDGWTDMTAAYRFLDNDQVTWRPSWRRMVSPVPSHPGTSPIKMNRAWTVQNFGRPLHQLTPAEHAPPRTYRFN